MTTSADHIATLLESAEDFQSWPHCNTTIVYRWLPRLTIFLHYWSLQITVPAGHIVTLLVYRRLPKQKTYPHYRSLQITVPTDHIATLSVYRRLRKQKTYPHYWSLQIVTEANHIPMQQEPTDDCPGGKHCRISGVYRSLRKLTTLLHY